jgi:hypothetical protein
VLEHLAKGEVDETGFLLTESHIDARQDGLGDCNARPESIAELKATGLLFDNVLTETKLTGQGLLINEDPSPIAEDNAVDPYVQRWIKSNSVSAYRASPLTRKRLVPTKRYGRKPRRVFLPPNSENSQKGICFSGPAISSPLTRIPRMSLFSKKDMRWLASPTKRVNS